ncbi:hypothetical protein [Sinomonas humi]|uniref:Uncharacterized protein n=1 Tax=Sinomonas humi TaxID=1338436 RepID=A0A0B2ACS0_9MICC|nr:hypothetical protein [Sinomonas humi]KHL01031.1 hypothetical protein LK10_17885 [Sinomonas humi]
MSHERSHAARTFWTALASAGASVAIGVLEIVPTGMATLVFTQLVLVHLGLAKLDTTFRRDWEGVQGATSLALLGFVPPLVLLLVWFLIIRSLARRSPAPWLVWILGAIGVAAPSILFIQSNF